MQNENSGADGSSCCENKSLHRASEIKTKGNKLFKAGCYADARNCYTDAIEICPPGEKEDLAILYQNRAAAHDFLRNYTAVVADCSKAIEFNRKYLKAFNRRANAYDALGELENAYIDFQCVNLLEAAEKTKNSFSGKRSENIVSQLSKQKAKETLQKQAPFFPSKTTVQVYFNSFYEDPILEDVKKLPTDLTSENAICSYQKVLCFLKEHKYEEALRWCNSEMDKEKSPFLEEALLLKATLLFLHGEDARSYDTLLLLQSYSSIKTKINVNSLIRMAIIILMGGTSNHIDMGYDCFIVAIGLDPNNVDIYHKRAEMHIFLKNIPAALKDLDKVVELQPLAFPDIVKLKLPFLKNSEEFFCISEQLKESLECFPNNWKVYLAYSQLMAMRSEVGLAVVLLKKASDLNPSNATLYIERACVSLQTDNLLEATDLLQKALNIDNRFKMAYKLLGGIELRKGNMREALQFFTKAIEETASEGELLELFDMCISTKGTLKASEIIGINLKSNCLNMFQQMFEKILFS